MSDEKGKKEEPKMAPRDEAQRKVRRPLGVGRQKLSLTKEQQEYFRSRGEVPRWVNDTPGRLEDASEGDSYRFVTKAELSGKGQVGQATVPGNASSRMTRVVGSNEDGSPITAYLMAKPIEDYEADMRERVDKIEAKEAEMKEGIDSYGAPGLDGRYIPQAGISVQRNRNQR